MADITKIKERLAALLTKSRDAGATPAEVADAMKMAQKIMAKYGVTESDLDALKASDWRQVGISMPQGQTKHCPVVRYCAAMVGKVAGVKFWFDGDQIQALGIDADVEFALWLLTSLRQFMDDQWTDYRDWQLGKVSRKTLVLERVGHVRGFTTVVNARLREMVDAAAPSGFDASTALVVRKEGLVNAEMKRRGINLGGAANMAGKGRGSATGQAAGAQAGGAANLGRGIGQNRVAIGAQ
tara:strand:- start:2640 stop:3359 length:720 start_codon:yes stop_codon:yes gene_type:complete